MVSYTTRDTRTDKKEIKTKQPDFIVFYAADIWKDMCIIFSWIEESQIYTWICLPSYSFVSSGRIFFPGFLWLCLWGLRDEKEGKKSPLVSAPQKQHPEPSCHPSWIKDPSLGAAQLLTWCFTHEWGVGGGWGWSRGLGHKKARPK